MRPTSRQALLAIFAAAALAATGCRVDDLRTADRLERGLVLVLPGIEGRSFANVNIARGLDEGGVDLGIDIVDWGTDVPGGMLLNLTDYARNRAVADRIRDRIRNYQRRHPGRPVHLIGHSGGAGVALMAVERLPRSQPVTTLVCLSGAVSPRHDLRKALQRVSGGVYNFYSRMDVALLGVGTDVFGTIDRDYGPAAGSVGFTVPIGQYPEEKELYGKLHQVEWSTSMIMEGHDGGHFGWTNRSIVANHLAPIILEQNRLSPPARRPVAERATGPQRGPLPGAMPSKRPATDPTGRSQTAPRPPS